MIAHTATTVQRSLNTIMKKLFVIAALALASCNTHPVASDGYTFEQKSELLEPRQIKVVLYPTLSSLKKEYDGTKNAAALPTNRALQAFSVIGQKTCTIHMVDPKVSYMPEFFGHELTHCLYGEFHPSQND